MFFDNANLQVSYTAVSLPLDSIWIWHREREGWMVKGMDELMDGCVWYESISTVSLWQLQPAVSLQHYGEEEMKLPSLNKNHVTELLFLKWAKSDALTCDSYSTVDGDIYWVKYNFIKSAMLLQFCISFVFSSI